MIRQARVAGYLAAALGALVVGCSGGGGKGGANADGADAGPGGASGGGGANAGSGGATAGGADASSAGDPIAPVVSQTVAALRDACERRAARDVECGAKGPGDTGCEALTAGWVDSDLGFGPELPDLSKLDAMALRSALGVDEADCKADCADAASCADVIAEAEDGACDGAADYTGPLDACRDACEDEFGGYACGDGQFVGKGALCDATADCANGHDEACVVDSFDCGGGVQLMHSRPSDLPQWDPTCDGKVQCDTTGKDEKGCTAEAFECIAGEFLSVDDVCDGKDECTNGADEADCDEFDCGDGSRIPARGVCDSDTNCANHSDDLDCPGWFVCADGKGAVAGNDVCEIQDLSDTELMALDAKGLAKLYDCPDKSDEEGCARVLCP